MVKVEFLPLGADANTAVYRVIDKKGTRYFLKLRTGKHHNISILLTSFLKESGISMVIAPISTTRGRLWVNLADQTLVLSPFVEGRDAYEVDFTAGQWQELGALVKRYHSLTLPGSISSGIAQETWTPLWRMRLQKILMQVRQAEYQDTLSCKLSAFLNQKWETVKGIVEKAESLARILQKQQSEFVLCHADLHPGNLLVTPSRGFYLVDWDDPVLAPRERDLMFPGGGQGFTGLTDRDEERWFYRGYGEYEVNRLALAYYRFERIVQDIAIFSDEIFGRLDKPKNRELSYEYLCNNFLPGGTIEAAYATSY